MIYNCPGLGTDLFMHSVTQVMSCSADYYSCSISSIAFEACILTAAPCYLIPSFFRTLLNQPSRDLGYMR